jgi:hypothetical protein
MYGEQYCSCGKNPQGLVVYFASFVSVSRGYYQRGRKHPHYSRGAKLELSDSHSFLLFLYFEDIFAYKFSKKK